VGVGGCDGVGVVEEARRSSQYSEVLEAAMYVERGGSRHLVRAREEALQ
jgi:hypothetical protein